MEARAFWVIGPGEGALQVEEVPPVGSDELRVRTLFSGVSRGTEALVFHGHVPESQYEAMRAPFQRGEFPYPVKYGYISVGLVEEGTKWVGQNVFCLHPHQDHYVVPASAVVPIPAGLPAERAVLTAHMETAITGVWDARLGPGDRVTVVGAGVVGCLVAWLVRQIPGTHVQLVDLDSTRAAIARTLQVSFATPDSALADRDAVFHTSGSPSGLVSALDLAGFEGWIGEMSWFGDRPAVLPLGESFHAKRLTLRSSQVGAIPPVRRPRWTHARRLQLALDLLQAPVLDALIDGESAFESLPETMKSLTASTGPLCHRVRYST